MARQPQQALTENVADPGPHETARENEHRSDRDHRFVGKPLQSLLVGDHTHQCQDEQHQQRYHVDPHAVGYEQDDRADHYGDDDEHVRGHGLDSNTRERALRL